MSDHFRPLAFEQLVDWAATELEMRGSLFGIPRAAFFAPRPDHRQRLRQHGVELETPFGVAAGPHTQMAQNIVAAWLAGARVIELKTVQTLDELEVHKPCIDAQDEGYNVEWSQELRVHESFDEYLRAWVLIHALHRRLGFPGERPGVLFTMSIGYNLEGILRPNVQWYLDAMTDAAAFLPAWVDVVARRFPAVRDVAIPARISDTVTLSTMHGCPPDEIERISLYLLEERGLHTSVKCNPTLLGADRVRGIVNGDLGFADVRIPDAAFGHDLRWEDAVPMFGRLRAAAAARGVGFGLKLSNTLEVENRRGVFDRDATMYLSGRALHPVTVNLADALADALADEVPISFAGGADCFNVADLLAGGLRTVTVCSDLLKTGGYLRLLQYPEQVDAAFDAVGAASIDDFVRRTAAAGGLAGAAGLGSAGGASGAGNASVADCARFNLRRYADRVRHDRRYRKDAFRTDRSKTTRRLDLFDCVEAPCVDECPVDQQVPAYLRAVRDGDLDEAVRITRLDNPLPAILGRVCDHLCEGTCVRTHLDEPLAIRQMKRFVMEHEQTGATGAVPRATDARVAIVGAGPAGLAAAEWLARAGVAVTVFEERPHAGGMVGGAIPAYRLPRAQVDADLAVLARLGVEIRYGQRVGVDLTLDGLRAAGYGPVFVAVGAQQAKRLGLPGEDAAGVIDGVTFLHREREGRPVGIGPRVAVVGAGDTAMDCARTARRSGASSVALLYRRTVDQMPADPEEVHAVRAEGIEIVELARPVGLRVEGGRLAGVTCRRTAYRDDRDAAGRKVPHDVPGTEFEIGVDTLVVAVSQHPVLDLFGAVLPELTPAGYLAVDPVTCETSIRGVYAGGDVAADGPASIVRAAADGKRAAAAIAAALGVGRGATAGGPAARPPAIPIPPDLQALVVRRARRAYRVPIRVTGLERRDGFEETVLGYSAEEAAREAARCLDCDRLCSLCVGVCPNIALQTYEAAPVRAELPALVVRGGIVVEDGSTPFAVVQGPQVAVVADLCNECGNCVTACPTAGRPYRDKPRLYLDRADFEAQESNAFLPAGDGVIEGRFDGATHRLASAGTDGAGRERVAYAAPGFRAVLDGETLALVEAVAAGAAEGEALSLKPAAVLATLLAGIAGSLPHLPAAGVGGTRIAPPLG